MKVKGMFGLHFQNLFSSYSLMDCVVDARNACFKVIPRKF
jgi:hypothetical protein